MAFIRRKTTRRGTVMYQVVESRDGEQTVLAHLGAYTTVDAAVSGLSEQAAAWGAEAATLEASAADLASAWEARTGKQIPPLRKGERGGMYAPPGLVERRRYWRRRQRAAKLVKMAEHAEKKRAMLRLLPPVTPRLRTASGALRGSRSFRR